MAVEGIDGEGPGTWPAAADIDNLEDRCPVRALGVDPQPEGVNGAGSGSSVGLQRDAGIGAGARPCRRSGGGSEFGQRPRLHFDGLFGQAKVDVDAFADHFDKFGQPPAPEAKAYAIRENDGASLSMGHFK